MADVFPRRNLPPLAEQWGRDVENRIVSSETGIETLQQGLSGQNRNTASSLSVIAGQIQDIQQVQEDLVGRVSYSTSDTNIFNDWTSSQPDNAAWGPTLTFTLDRPRVVSLSFSTQLSTHARVNASGQTANSFIYASLFIDGVGLPFSGTFGTSSTVVDLIGADPVRVATSDVPTTVRQLVTLGAGAHSIQGGFSRRRVQPTGGGVGSVTASTAFLFADALQPA